MKEFSLPPTEIFNSCGVKHLLSSMWLLRDAVLLSLEGARSDGIGLKSASSILGDNSLRLCTSGGALFVGIFKLPRLGILDGCSFSLEDQDSPEGRELSRSEFEDFS